MSTPDDPVPKNLDAAEADTTAELWDRIGEDLATRGRPCVETVERLVDEACHRPARPANSPAPPDVPDSSQGAAPSAQSRA